MKKKINLTFGIKLINKKFGKNQFYHYLEVPNNSIIIPKYKNKFVIVSQRRIPINKVTYEFPSGWVDKGESPLNSAKRELLEETGYKCLNKPTKLLTICPEAGRLKNKNYCFFCEKTSKTSKPEKGVEVHLVSKNQIIKLIKSEKFNNASHIAAFYTYLYRRN